MALLKLIPLCTLICIIAIIIYKWEWYGGGNNYGDGGEMLEDGGGDDPSPNFPTIVPTGPNIIVDERPATKEEMSHFTEAVSSERFIEVEEMNRTL